MSEKRKPYMDDPEVAAHYGFEWPARLGPDGGARVQVTRMASIAGRRVLLVATEHAQLQIGISPSGREITVYGDLKAVARG